MAFIQKQHSIYSAETARPHGRAFWLEELSGLRRVLGRPRTRCCTTLRLLAPELWHVRDYVQLQGVNERINLRRTATLSAFARSKSLLMWDCGHVGPSFPAGRRAHIPKQSSCQESACSAPRWLISDLCLTWKYVSTKRRRTRRTGTKELTTEPRKSTLSIHGAAVYFEKRLLFLPCWWIVILLWVRLVFCN